MMNEGEERPDRVRRRIRVRGRVQGVNFRAATSDRADALGLVGWVRNREDGSVEIEAEGPRAAVDQLGAWARRGPPAARVEGVEEDEITPEGAEAAFQIRA